MADSDDEIIDAYLTEKVADDNATTPVASDEEVIEDFVSGEEEKDKAETKKDEAETKKDEAEKGKDEEEQKGIAEILADLRQLVSQAHGQAINLPTPGGIGALLLLLFFIIWALVPTKSGYTRLQLLWLTLTDRTVLVGGTYPSIATGAYSEPTTSFTPPAPVAAPVTTALTTVAPGGAGGAGGQGGGLLNGFVPHDVIDFGAE